MRTFRKLRRNAKKRVFLQCQEPLIYVISVYIARKEGALFGHPLRHSKAGRGTVPPPGGARNSAGIGGLGYKSSQLFFSYFN